MHRKLLPGLLALGLAAILAACAGGSGDGPPDWDPDPPPGGGGTHEIAGFVRTPTLDRSVNGTVVSVCTGGSGCAGAGSVVASLTVSRDGPQAPFRFTNLPDGSYDVVGYKELTVEGGAFPGAQVPDIWYFARASSVPAGKTDVELHLEFEASEPTNGTAVMTGTLELPGSLGATGATAQLRAGHVVGGPARRGYVTVRPEPGREQDPEAAGAAAPAGAGLPREVFEGEVIVTFEDDTLFNQATLSTLSAAGITLQHVAGGAGGELHLYRADGLDAAATIALARELREQPNIRTAMPNWRLHAFATPNDEDYVLQWHYRAMNLEAAWDIETGEGSPVTVAVVDTGSISHPDLQFTGGYDFVSDHGTEGDGTGGRDPDPTDVGDSYHGAHVAGTVAASTNNNIGVAGVSWGATLVPVRALGADGSGGAFDILDSVSWAAGESVAGVPANPNPADVINLSLGADLGVTCAEALGGSDAFFSDLVARTGVVIVAAAGNSGINARHTFPASCPGVITVGATGPDGYQASYSNFGDVVDVMAPGGDLTRRFTAPDGRTRSAGILSTVLDGSGQPGYAFHQGSSMAAPHIAGIIALMLAQDPGLSAAEVLAGLRAAANPVPGCGATACGSGLVDAAAALGSGPVEPPAPPPVGSAPLYMQLDYCLNDLCTSIDYSRSQIRRFDDMELPVEEYVIWNLEPGRYYVWAFHDLDDDELYDPEEPIAMYGQVTLLPNSVRSNVDLRLDTRLD